MSLIASLALLVSPGPVVAPATRPLGEGDRAPDLAQQLSTWYRTASRAAPGTWGIAIGDQNGQLLWGVNATEPLIPASTVKVFTTGFARSVLGADARQRTRVVGAGQTGPDGTWLGTWALELNGDPTLERQDKDGPTIQELANQLAIQGIRRLTGPLTVQSANGPAEATFPRVWASRHRGRLFAPPIGPLTLNENLVTFAVGPGAKSGATPIIMGASPTGLQSMIILKAKTVAGRSQRLTIRALNGGRFQVTGTIGVHARARGYTGVSRDPHAVLEASWAHALRLAGIRWDRDNDGAVYAGDAVPQTLAEVTSAPFDSVASEVNRRSLNLGAELLLRWAAGSDSPGELLTEHVRQVTGEQTGVHLVDGSGLSSDDRASAWSFVSYLANYPNQPSGRNFPLLLPANGTGTLKRLVRGLPGSGVVRAKTGTLGNAATLVGYLGRPDGVLVISLMYNGGSVYAARQQQWKLFRILGADGVVIDGEAAIGEVGSD